MCEFCSTETPLLSILLIAVSTKKDKDNSDLVFPGNTSVKHAKNVSENDFLCHFSSEERSPIS